MLLVELFFMFFKIKFHFQMSIYFVCVQIYSKLNTEIDGKHFVNVVILLQHQEKSNKKIENKNERY